MNKRESDYFFNITSSITEDFNKNKQRINRINSLTTKMMTLANDENGFRDFVAVWMEMSEEQKSKLCLDKKVEILELINTLDRI